MKILRLKSKFTYITASKQERVFTLRLYWVWKPMFFPLYDDDTISILKMFILWLKTQEEHNDEQSLIF